MGGTVGLTGTGAATPTCIQEEGMQQCTGRPKIGLGIDCEALWETPVRPENRTAVRCEGNREVTGVRRFASH